MDVTTKHISKKLYRILAEHNLNIPYGDNEYGEISPVGKKALINGIKQPVAMAGKIMKYITCGITGLFLLATLLFILLPIFGVVFEPAYILVMIIMFLIAFTAAHHIQTDGLNDMSYIVNSKMELKGDYFTYSYSSLNPKRTEDEKQANYCEMSMRYEDVKNMYYNETNRCFVVRGDYEYRMFINYASDDKRTPSTVTKTVKNENFEICDVFRDKTLFETIAQKAGVTIQPWTQKFKVKSKSVISNTFRVVAWLFAMGMIFAVSADFHEYDVFRRTPSATVSTYTREAKPDKSYLVTSDEYWRDGGVASIMIRNDFADDAQILKYEVTDYKETKLGDYATEVEVYAYSLKKNRARIYTFYEITDLSRGYYGCGNVVLIGSEEVENEKD